MQVIISNFLSSKFYRIFKIVYLIFMTVIVIFSVDIFSPYHSFTNNISDSMNPSINKGSVTIVKQFPTYNVGEIITYYYNNLGVEEVVTHRITGIGGNVYTTKGDANVIADRELVKPRLVIGKVILIIPILGYIIAFAKSLLGNIFCIVGPAALISFLETMNIIIYLEKNKS